MQVVEIDYNLQLKASKIHQLMLKLKHIKMNNSGHLYKMF